LSAVAGHAQPKPIATVVTTDTDQSVGFPFAAAHRFARLLLEDERAD